MYTHYESGDESLNLENIMTLAIEDFDKFLQHNVYPNPTNNTVTFEFKGNSADLKIWNILGEEVLEKRIVSKDSQSVVNLRSGVYLYQIKNGHGVAKRKLIIY